MIVAQAMRRSFERHAGRTATLFEGRHRTWQEVSNRVTRFASALIQLGLTPGSRVGVLALNSDRYLECYMAIPWAGGVIVPLNTRWSMKELGAALSDCAPSMLIVDDAFAAMAAELVSQVPSIRALINFDASEPAAAGLAYEALIAKSSPAEAANASPDDLLGIFYTGGTTGRAKGVMLSNRNVASNAVNTMLEFEYGSSSTYLHAAPMFHLADGASVYAVTMTGGSHAIVPAFEPRTVIAAIKANQVTHSMFVPTMLSALLDEVAAQASKLDTLRRVIYGAAPMPEALLRRAIAAFPNAGFVQGYGMTELAPLATVLEPERHRLDDSGESRLGSAGRATFGVEIRVIDPDGLEVPRGQPGEISARGDNVMMGYWNRPQETAEALSGGWMATGDFGFLDECGYLYVVDRIKDMIISGGENVYSAEVECALYRHPDILQCAVIGIPNQQWGEAVHAVVNLRPESLLSSAEIIAFCRQLIAGYKCPKTVDIRTDPLPTSAAGKILKSTLRTEYFDASD